MSKKILVVEDQPEIRRLIRMTLEFENYQISESSTAMEGAAAVEQLRPDLLLLDVMTPGGMDGLELCRRVKQEGDGLYRPAVILLTARGQQQDIDAGLAAGADAYLLKPFSPLQLLDTVSSMLAVA
ncbi:MAG: response regulator [Pseudomonadota bacterium]